jgi:hypothetical protein
MYKGYGWRVFCKKAISPARRAGLLRTLSNIARKAEMVIFSPFFSLFYARREVSAEIEMSK